jgi:hypothetical protein
MKEAADDVRRFIRTAELPSLQHWTDAFFVAQCDKVK